MFRADLVLAKEDLGMPRVLARDHVDILQNPQRTQRDVLEIADRRRDEIELAHAMIFH
jgi:hypothetical protein